MEFHASCHCGRVSFDVLSRTPVPYLRCYCSACRKCQSAGYCIDILAEFKTLKVRGEEYIKVYQAIADKAVPVSQQRLSGYLRYFCGECGSHLYGYNAKYPDNVYPMASAIDTTLPKPRPEDVYRVWMNKESICSWVTCQ